MSRILITGARGFLGQALVRAARSAGHDVVALSRGAGPVEWREDAGITSVKIDLGAAAASKDLSTQLNGVTAVIHAAASFAGDANAHARDTVGATQNLVAALETVSTLPRLVLVSSLSVYDTVGMDDDETLHEGTPLIDRPEQRDAYAAAKVAQERVVGTYSGSVHVVRPGAIYGPHRLWSAQLGFAKAGRVFCPRPDALMPAIEVNRAAAAIVRAASGQGADFVNLIDPNPPTRADWLSALGQRIVPVPQWLVLFVAKLTGRNAAWQARFRPLRYDTTRAEVLLDPVMDHPFQDLIKNAKSAEDA